MMRVTRERKPPGLLHYYNKIIRNTSISGLGHKLDPDIDQAMDFTCKLDRKLFQPMITKMDWLEESKIREYQVQLFMLPHTRQA